MEFALIAIRTLLMIFDVIQWVIFVWVILSWVLFFLRNSQFRWRHRQFYGLLEQLNDLFERMTRPFLRPIRRFLRRFDTAGIDWSPMVLILIIYILRQILAAVAGRLILSGSVI
ncbi:MAG: YggT family protein [Acidobacteriota bacterium]|nr:YggT family protein [Acidobacteriota bacterium]